MLVTGGSQTNRMYDFDTLYVGRHFVVLFFPTRLVRKLLPDQINFPVGAVQKGQINRHPEESPRPNDVRRAGRICSNQYTIKIQILPSGKNDGTSFCTAPRVR